MAIVLINEIPTEVGSGADEIIRLREELASAEKVCEGLIKWYTGLAEDAKRYRWLRDTQEGKTVRILDRREWDEAIRKEKTE